MPAKSKGFRALWLLVAAFLAGCVGPAPQINMFSLEQEIEMGRQISREIAREATIVKDPFMAGYVQELGMRLVPPEAARALPFRFYLLDNKEVNAFAVPGGPVYIHTGLFRAAENEAELASVMAHEIGHVVARHAGQQMTARYGYSFLASLLLGQNPGGWQALTASLFASAGLMAYSRTHEREADGFAIQALYRAGYDAWAMLTFFDKLITLEKGQPNALARFFSSHPPTSERMSQIRATLVRLPSQPNSIRQTGAFLRVKERVPVSP